MRWHFPTPYRSKRPKVAVVRLQGVISSSGGRGAMSLASVAPLLDRAFRKGKPTAVALVLNSPGGSPVQSSLIGTMIRDLAQETSVPVHAFIEDVAASGGYWLAAAADDIWLDRSSITGSIGVISAGFGFQDLIARHGIERRVHTAGEDKSMLDPFRAERASDVERLKALQSKIHAAFIDHVRSRRADKLDQTKDLFTGEIFVGEDAVEVGLADGIGHMEPKMREIYGQKVRFVRLSQRQPFLKRIVPGLSAQIWDDIEQRALWARYGL